uniref:Uncharacterized protein n=1 Tax=Nelumbo nucifera TaxID=4432 RepID=A0A822YLP1_NELNU|nr:TPA_asm: hypothetical protein HUJ06_011060 [Nelumbo nucifera]
MNISFVDINGNRSFYIIFYCHRKPRKNQKAENNAFNCRPQRQNRRKKRPQSNWTATLIPREERWERPYSNTHSFLRLVYQKNNNEKRSQTEHQLVDDW